MRPLGIATWILAAMALFILWGAAHAEYSLLPESAKSSLERCYRRCEKNNPPIPSPQPTRSPAPTIGKACDYYVKDSRTITFAVQSEPQVVCIDPPSNPSPFVEISTVNAGNASCADFWLQAYSPNGAITDPSIGPQPAAILRRVPGRYYAAVVLRQANNTACATLTFTVR